MATQISSPDIQNRTVSSELPFDLDESSIAAWLNDLPVSDNLETCKTVFAALQNLNRRSIDIGDRFAILESFRTIVFLESAYLASRLGGTSFPLDRKTRKIAKLSAKFHSELSSGYQLIANHDKFEGTYSRDRQACVLQRIIRSTGMSFLRIAQMYEPPSSSAWQLLKKIYREAESKQLLDIQVQDPTISHAGSTSVARSLGTTALFAVVNPYRYPQTEMDRLFRLFDAHSMKIEWLKNISDDCGTVFGIDLENELGPQSLSPIANLRNRSIRMINTGKFAQALSASAIVPAHQRSAPKETTVTTLLHHLGNAESARIKNLGVDADLLLGLDKIVALLKFEQSKPAAQKSGPSADWLVTPNFELLPLNDYRPGAKVSERSDSRNESIRARMPSAANTGNRTDDIWGSAVQCGIESNSIRCEIHQSSLDGHALLEMKTDSLTVGQIVALEKAQSSLQIGVIRWMQPGTDNFYFYYGVELLTSKCSLANVFISSRKHNDVILLEKNPSGFASFGMIMPPAKYRTGTRLTVKLPRMTRNFVIEKLLATNPFFCHYSLSQMHSG